MAEGRIERLDACIEVDFGVPIRNCVLIFMLIGTVRCKLIRYDHKIDNFLLKIALDWISSLRNLSATHFLFNFFELNIVRICFSYVNEFDGPKKSEDKDSHEHLVRTFHL